MVSSWKIYPECDVGTLRGLMQIWARTKFVFYKDFLTAMDCVVFTQCHDIRWKAGTRNRAGETRREEFWDPETWVKRSRRGSRWTGRPRSPVESNDMTGHFLWGHVSFADGLDDSQMLFKKFATNFKCVTPLRLGLNSIKGCKSLSHWNSYP